MPNAICFSWPCYKQIYFSGLPYAKYIYVYWIFLIKVQVSILHFKNYINYFKRGFYRIKIYNYIICELILKMLLEQCISQKNTIRTKDTTIVFFRSIRNKMKRYFNTLIFWRTINLQEKHIYWWKGWTTFHLTFSNR